MLSPDTGKRGGRVANRYEEDLGQPRENEVSSVRVCLVNRRRTGVIIGTQALTNVLDFRIRLRFLRINRVLFS